MCDQKLICSFLTQLSSGELFISYLIQQPQTTDFCFKLNLACLGISNMDTTDNAEEEWKRNMSELFSDHESDDQSQSSKKLCVEK